MVDPQKIVVDEESINRFEDAIAAEKAKKRAEVLGEELIQEYIAAFKGAVKNIGNLLGDKPVTIENLGAAISYFSKIKTWRIECLVRNCSPQLISEVENEGNQRMGLYSDIEKLKEE